MHTQFIDTGILSSKLCKYQIQTLLKYATQDNITGSPLPGYQFSASNLCLLTKETALQLCKIQNDLNDLGYGLYIYDAYRPQKAVNHLLQWSLEEENNTPHFKYIKNSYYPNYSRKVLFELGYISKNSNHCYGHTVDCTLISLSTQQPLDMGGAFDLMDKQSHIDCLEIDETALYNRSILLKTMIRHGFEPFTKEWWHFSYPPGKLDKPSNFDIVATLKGLNVQNIKL